MAIPNPHLFLICSRGVRAPVLRLSEVPGGEIERLPGRLQLRSLLVGGAEMRLHANQVCIYHLLLIIISVRELLIRKHK